MANSDQYYIEVTKNERYSFRFFEMATGEKISLDKLKKSKIWREISPKERDRLTDVLSKPPFKK